MDHSYQEASLKTEKLRKMMIKRSLIIFIMIAVGIFSQLLSRQPQDEYLKAENGRMDLASWDTKDTKILKLDGEWEFYWDELLGPEDFKTGSHTEPDGYMQVPSLWNGKTLQEEKLPVFGCATYRLVLDEIPLRGVLGLKKNNIRLSSRIYVNGQELMSDGVPAQSAADYQSGNTPQIGFFNYNGGKIEIILQTANYEYINAGIPASIELGNETAMLDRHQKDSLFAFAVFIILWTIALLNFIFYFAARISGRREVLMILFSAFCFLFAIANGLADQRPLLLVLPDIPFTLVFKMKDFFLTANFIVVILIFHKFGLKLLSSKLAKGICLGYGVFLAAIVLLPIHVYYKFYQHMMLCNTAILLILFVRAAVLFIKKSEGLVLFAAILSINLYSVDCILFSVGLKEDSGFGQVYILVFALVMIAFLSLQYYTALDRLQHSMRREQEAEIAFLRAQINPHFLYNTLNSIAALCREAPAKAEDVVVELSRYLRGSFDFKRMDSMSTLTKEKELLEAYLYIEKIRFGDRLRVEYNIDEDLYLPVPPLILQPLVENAVRHGLMKKTAGGTVTISIRKQDKEAVFIIADNGIGMENEKLELLLEDKRGKGGIGVWNINKRLNMLYGKGLTVSSEIGRGTSVTFALPLESKENITKVHKRKENRKDEGSDC